ncbi:MAG: hypothetical protein KME15_13945 [Drouetiella hepatica Uher 2000/2452]|jgi:hypothetical protein|uniref:Uncharacterized protein n=1 Tax=Drouetiella hepatica Uher 2000/2452 TaxID=904376 RepID=A0A951QDJ8_9CYAN|nr:hypothetical protein [Drouetiella hepatica Uher 2000/2452]
MAMIEVFVILQVVVSSVSGEAADRVRTHFEVTAALPPRILIVQIPIADLTALQELDGVAAVATNSDQLNVTPPLSETERLFIAGWMARGVKSGPRAGDGQAWDAPGFVPPDGQRR